MSSNSPCAISAMERLGTYLHQRIPISKAMGVAVEAVRPDRIILAAPIEPNLNHKSTAFGGSISAVAILSGWALIHLRLKDVGLDAELVIRRNEIAYTAAVRARFIAEARLAEADNWAAFEHCVRRGRMARIKVVSVISSHGQPCATLRGEFVAVPSQSG